MAIAGLVFTLSARAQSNAEPEEFTAVAVLNSNLGSGVGNVIMNIDRWSSDADRQTLVTALLEKGSDDLLAALRKAPKVGRIRTPDSLGYDLHYAYQARNEDGGRRIVIATDRPIGFWEATNQPRTIDYPFTVIQMEIGADGEGHGTISYATKITAHDGVIELEHFGTSPIMLTKVKVTKKEALIPPAARPGA